MSDKPTPEDMGRSLEADLALCEAEPKGLDSLQRWERELFCLARTGWPSAIRRALAAEAEAARLREAAASLVAACKAARGFGSQGETHEGISVSYLLDTAIADARAALEDHP